MAEVARQAGVSITTVSHVINGTRRVNEKTTARVYAAIERTGYTPHSIARALAGARTQSIGLAISGITNPYFMDVVAAIEAEAAANGHTLYLFRADSGTKSACYGQCATYWPPLLTTGKPVAAAGIKT